MRGRATLAIVTIALIGGCATILDIDQFHVVDTSDAGAEAGGSETGPIMTDNGGVDLPDATPTCNAPSSCRTPPAGFEGPFAVFLKSGASCPAPFTRSWERVGAQGNDAAAPPATCTCGCGALTGSCTFRLQEYIGDGCGGSFTTRVLTAGVCSTTKDGADYFRGQVQALGSCAPDASTTIASLDAGTLALGCSPSAPAGCADGICVPPPPEGARLCVRPNVAGASACPPEYPSKVDVPAGVEDTRTCTPCTCAASPSCTFQYKLYDEGDCTGIEPTHDDPNCHGENGIDSVKLLSTNLSGSCAPAGGAPTGGVTVKAVSSLCCLP